MGRYAKVPLKNGKLVRKTKVSTSHETPYHPRDVHWKALRRMGFDNIPQFRDEMG